MLYKVIPRSCQHVVQAENNRRIKLHIHIVLARVPLSSARLLPSLGARAGRAEEATLSSRAIHHSRPAECILIQCPPAAS